MLCHLTGDSGNKLACVGHNNLQTLCVFCRTSYINGLQRFVFSRKGVLGLHKIHYGALHIKSKTGVKWRQMRSFTADDASKVEIG